MRRTLVYFVILVILAFGIYYFLFKDSSSSPFSKTEAGFTVKDTAAIGKIFLVAQDGESVLIERTDSGWVVNKQYKVLRSTLSLLLLTLEKQAPLYPVTKSARENVIKELTTDGIKVEVYNRSGGKMTVFYVGGSAVNGLGTNMLMADAKDPFVVQVQGFNGYLTPRYSTKLRDWRDRVVFNIAPENIKRISVQYPDKPLNSFVIEKDNGKFTVQGDPQITKTLDSLNTRRIGIYMKYFTNVNCEGFLNGLQDMNSTIKTAPAQSVIDIEDNHGEHQHADIYWMAINKRSKNITVSNPDVPDDYDADRLYAVVNNAKDTVLIQQFTFSKIFKKAYEFYQRDDVMPATKTPAVPKNLLMKNAQ